MNFITQYRGLRKENYILFWGRIVTNLGAMIYPVMTLILNQKLGMNASDVALYTLISGIVILPAGIIGGKLADKYNKKKIIIFCDIASVILFFLCGFIPLSIITIALLVIASSFQSLEDPVYTALIADITPAKDRERAYSLMYLGANLGLVASPTIAGMLFKNYLWLSFILSGVSLATSTVMIALFLKDISKVSDDEEVVHYESTEGVKTWDIITKHKSVLLFVLSNGLFWGIYSLYGYIIPLDLGRIHGQDGAVLYGSVASLNCIEVVIFTPLFTKLLKNISLTKKNVLGQLLTFGGYGMFLIFAGHVPCYYLAMSLFTFGEIVNSLAGAPYIANRVPSSHRGRVNGLMSFLRNFLYGAIMICIGNVYDYVGYVQAWMIVLVLIAVAITGATILIGLDKKEFGDSLVSDNQ